MHSEYLPQVLRALPMEHYVADQLPHVITGRAITLSASGVGCLLDQGPAEFAARHPRLTRWPEWQQGECKSSRSQNLGTIAHATILQSGEEAPYECIDPRDYKTAKGEPCKDFKCKAAQEARQAIIDRGRLPVHVDDMKNVLEAAERANEALRAEFGELWPGESEETYLWLMATASGQVVCRARTDHVILRAMAAFDLKMTEGGLSDAELNKHATAYGWPMQQVVHSAGIIANHSSLTGRLSFRFFVQQFRPPFANRWYECGGQQIHDAGVRFERAANSFARHVAADDWYGTLPACRGEQPGWLASKYEAEELINETKVS